MPTVRLRPTRKTFQANLRDNNLKLIIEDSWKEDQDTIPASLRTMANRLAVVQAWSEYMEVTYPELKGKEFIDTDEYPMKERVYGFLFQRVASSKARGRKGHMSFSSLLTLRWTFLSTLLDNMESPNQKQWTDDTYMMCKAIQRRYNLESLPMDRMLFGIQEIRLLVEEALSAPVNWENSLQHCCSMLMHFLFGPRPSSLYTGQQLKTFLQHKNIILRRGAHPGMIEPTIYLTVFKGHMENQIKLTYTIRCPTELRNLFMYLGGMMLALAIRRGDLRDHKTCSSVWKDWHSAGETLHWADLALPFFRAGGPRGLTVTMEPLSDQGARAFFHKLAGNVGIDGAGGMTMSASPYGCRANFGTEMAKAVGLAIAGRAMAHGPKSTALSESYDQGNSRLDFFGIMAGERIEPNVQTGRNIAIYRAPITVTPLGLAELVEKQPLIAILLKQAQNLRSAMLMEAGDDERWKDLIYDQDILTDDDTIESCLQWTLKRTKALIATTRAQHVTDVRQEASRQMQDNITVAMRRERMAEMEKPSTLAEMLKQARLKCLESDMPIRLGDIETDDSDDAEIPPMEIYEPSAQEDEEAEQPLPQHVVDLARMEFIKYVLSFGIIPHFASETTKKAHMKAKLHNPDARAIRMLKKANASTTFSPDRCPYCTERGHNDLARLCEHIVERHIDHEDIPLDVYRIYDAMTDEGVLATRHCLSEEDRAVALVRTFEFLKEQGGAGTDGLANLEWVESAEGFEFGGEEGLAEEMERWGAMDDMDVDQ
ncbi:hypothetical protein DFH08DRAFT_948872 [Mycena albidolilacea]|uniref:Uncharacterized protein n=1 Tax=Mycena albidolilacea TaxID=1033008 RepID=A0AAD7ARZ4_9AGAR|nr:hypothetical protein DFH08DRAFT_948872 [Mycena albidolilacea]